MHLCDRPTSTATVRVHHLALFLCWAAVAFFQIAGIKTHATGGPALAPRPAVRGVMRQSLFG